jgi:uncharacterized protein YodC (DUF2158 family)
MHEFEIGMSVTTKLGGPLMMIRDYAPNKAHVDYLCFWFSDSLAYYSEWFPASLLIPADGIRKVGFAP